MLNAKTRTVDHTIEKAKKKSSLCPNSACHRGQLAGVAPGWPQTEVWWFLFRDRSAFSIPIRISNMFVSSELCPADGRQADLPYPLIK